MKTKMYLISIQPHENALGHILKTGIAISIILHHAGYHMKTPLWRAKIHILRLEEWWRIPQDFNLLH